MAYKKENIVTIDPWNDNNNLLTKDDVYKIYEKAGIKNARDVIEINNLLYYQIAFVHSSYVKNKIFEDNSKKNKNSEDSYKVQLTEQPKGSIDLFEEYQDYENQEFLGDRALDFSVAFYICRNFPERDQGFKTVLKTKLVKTNTLAKFAKYLGFPKHLIISKQVEEKTKHGRFNDRILEDVMEAFICGIFLDQNETKYYSEIIKNAEPGKELQRELRLIGPGWQIVNCLVENLLERVIDWEDLLGREENYKEQLLQYYQREFKITPEYISISIEGPPHQRIFTQGVIENNGHILGRGVGKKKAEAEQNASLDALKYFGEIN